MRLLIELRLWTHCVIAHLANARLYSQAGGLKSGVISDREEVQVGVGVRDTRERSRRGTVLSSDNAGGRLRSVSWTSRRQNEEMYY